jgi:hypothetical protein
MCVPGDGGQLDELVTRTRTGVVLRTPDEIADHLRVAYERHRSGAGIAYAPDEGEVARYSRRVLTGELAAVLARAVASAPARAAHASEDGERLPLAAARAGGAS